LRFRLGRKGHWLEPDARDVGVRRADAVARQFDTGCQHLETMRGNEQRDTFHGRLFDATPEPDNPAVSIVGDRIASDNEVAESLAAWLQDHLGSRRPVFVSDYPAYDWQ
jgi:hypothetical protein